MSELEDKLNSILGDPQAMSQIMSLAKSLNASSSDHSAPSASSPEPPPQPTSPAPDLTSLLGGLTGGSGLDPRLMQLALRVMNEYQSDDDDRTALLLALRPFIKEERYAKLDKAIQIARISRLIRIGLDVFKGGETDRV